MSRIVLALCVLAAMFSGSAVAQERSAGSDQPGSTPTFAPRVLAEGLTGPLSVPAGHAAQEPAKTRKVRGNPDRAFLASLAVPGAGQYMLGQARWVPYAVVETYGWLRFTERRSTASRLARRYRDLAWSSARAGTGVERRDTTFAYYELLTKSTRSGAFDAAPSEDGVQPEDDPATYNGEQWRLARALFVPLGSAGLPGTPGYDAALGYYMANAIPDAYAFAWPSGTDRARYTALIKDSDDAYSSSSIVVGLILANHLTSSIDALITARLRRGGRDLRFESGIVPDERGRGWHAPLRLETAVRYSW
jgi:hypothetical protein